jgi:hypothetical protein
MQRAGIVDRVVALLLSSETDVDAGLAHRLVRLLGTFSIGCDCTPPLSLLRSCWIRVRGGCLDVLT